MSSSRYPVSWRVLDVVESLVATTWPTVLRRYTRYAFLLPAVLVVFLIVAGSLYMVDASLRLLDTETFETSAEYTLGNYSALVERHTYFTVLMRSAIAACVVTALTLLLAFPYAYVMIRTRSAWARKLLLLGLFLPFFIGQVVRAYGWLVILGKQGILNTVLGSVGLGPYSLIYNFPSVLFGLVQYMLPFAVLLIAPAIAAIDEEVELASETLGAHWVNTFRHVTLPMAKPGLVAAAIVVFALTITDYAMPVILGGGTNDFIANAVYDAFFRISDDGLGSALAIVLVLIASTLVAIMLTLLGAGTLGFSTRANSK